MRLAGGKLSPAEEIERLKRLTPEKRAKLMASFKVPTNKCITPSQVGLIEDADPYYRDANQYSLFDFLDSPRVQRRRVTPLLSSFHFCWLRLS